MDFNLLFRVVESSCGVSISLIALSPHLFTVIFFNTMSHYYANNPALILARVRTILTRSPRTLSADDSNESYLSNDNLEIFNIMWRGLEWFLRPNFTLFVAVGAVMILACTHEEPMTTLSNEPFQTVTLFHHPNVRAGNG